jgi:DNA-binding transcriptional regulator YiaG
LAAVLYGIGARLDESPELLFTLRGVDHNELISTDIQLPSTGKRRRISGDIADVFGVELSQNDEASEIVAAKKITHSKPVKKAKTSKSATLTDKSVDPFTATGPAVRRLRKQLDMNKTQFATLIGVSLSTITNWESKRGKLSLKDTSLNALSRLSKLSFDAAWKRLGKGGGC